MPRLLGSLLVAFLCTPLLLAQASDDHTYGHISDADRQLLQLPGDSTAEAYVLYDHMDLDFEYSDVSGPGLVERYHRRLKLFTPSAYERANVTITYHRDRESIADVEGLVQLPGGGTIVLRGEDFISQQEDDEYSSIRFTFPKLTPGATIEYRYTRRDRSIMQPTRYTFQEDIPVRWAEFTAMVPAYYDYVSLGSADRYDINEAEIVERVWGPSFNVTAYSNGAKLDHTRIRWALRDLPAFKPQPYANNLTDYLPRVRLQLRSVQYPTGGRSEIFSSWEQTADELQSRKDFGRYYRNRSNYKQLWEAAEPTIAAAAVPRAKIEAAYQFVVHHYSWDGRYRILASDSPNNTFGARRGNSADLNLALLSLLNEAGIAAWPLLVSLRDRGAPIEAYPLLDQFDHLMVYTEVDGQPLLLDANDPDRPAGLPRQQALNQRGWVADRDAPRWVNLDVPPSRQTVMVDMAVDPTGLTTASFRSRLEQYFAFEGRSQLRSAADVLSAPLTATVRQQFPETTVLEAEASPDGDGEDANLTLHLKLSVPAGQALNDFLYVQPVLLPMLDDELDDVESRQFPIDFAYPWARRYIATVALPEGFVVDELPPSVRVKSEDGSIMATYMVQEVPGKHAVHVNFTTNFDRTLFAAAEYPALRDMFRRIIEMQQSPIVLKRAK